MPAIAQEWASRVHARRTVLDADWDPVVRRFLELTCEMLPAALGPLKHEVEPLWTALAELFGTVAAGRGLAAGEPVEELQILRELIIRGLYEDESSDAVPPLRDALLLNRVLDLAVVHASVGHTDALFVQLLDEHGEAPSVDAAGQAIVDLGRAWEQLAEMLPGAAAGSTFAH